MSAISHDAVISRAKRLARDLAAYLKMVEDPSKKVEAIAELRAILAGKPTKREQRLIQLSRGLTQRKFATTMDWAFKELMPVVTRIRKHFMAFKDPRYVEIADTESDKPLAEHLVFQITKHDIAEFKKKDPEATEAEFHLALKWTPKEIDRLCSMRASDWLDDTLGLRVGRGRRAVRAARVKAKKHPPLK